jgi:TonB-dependent receptor
MRIDRFKLGLTGTSALAAFTFATLASPLAAQPASAPAATVEEPQTVVVTGARPIAESDRAALNAQRSAVSLVSVVSADEAGRLADQNIAFAVGRLPGVALERDQGQARYVNLRGQPRRWTNISVDGLNIISPEGRQTRFDNTPSAIASRVTVTKAVTPDMPGDTVSGNIDIRTRSAFDYRGRAIRGGVQLGRVELGGGDEIDANIVVADRFFGDTFGLLAQASYYQREMVTDNWETDPWLQPGGVVQGQTAISGFDRRPGSELRSWAREHENKLYRLTRGNISGSLRADWRPSDTVSLFAQTVYTEFTDNELRNNYIFRFDNGLVNTPTTACPATGPIPVTGGNGAYDICNGNTPFQGTVYGVRLANNFRTASIKEFVSTTTFGGEYELGEDTEISWRLNYTYTEDGQTDAVQPFFRNGSTATDRPTVFYDFTDPKFHRVELYRTLVAPGTGVRSRGERVMNIDSFAAPFLEMESVDGGSSTDAWTGKIDIARDIELFGAETTLKGGLLFTRRVKTNDPDIYFIEAGQLSAAGRPLPTYSQFAIPGSFLGEMPLGYTFQYYSQGAMLAYSEELKAAGIFQRDTEDERVAFYEVSEETIAAYLMATSRFDWGSAVYGLRLERTVNTGEAFSRTGSVFTPVSTEREGDLEAFPSVHINWDLNDEVKLRFGLTTGASRPDYDQLAPNFQIDNGPTITGGNPDARPERAIGLDAYFEWYMQPQGYVSVGAFAKSLEDVLFSTTQLFGSDILGPERADFNFTTVRNGGEGYIRGLEFVWNQFAEPWVEQLGGPDWMKGIGWRFTATLTDSEMTIPAVGTAPQRKLPLVGASDIVANISLVYERYGWSARLAYQYRSDWIQSVGSYATVNGALGPAGNGDIYWQADPELDFSLRYELNDNIQLTFDAVNLGDVAAMRYADNSSRPIEWEKFGPRFLVGARFKY